MGTLSDNQLAALLRKAGVSAGDAAYLVAIAHPESSADPAEVQQGQPYDTTGWGLWQITPGNSEPGVAVDQGLLSPQANANAAAAKLKSQGLDAWTTYTSGKYQPYFPAAESAVASVYGMPVSKVDQLAASAGTGGSGSTPLQTGGLLSGAGSLLHGVAVVLDRAFAMFAPGQGWRVVFGVSGVLLAFLSFRAFSGAGA
jgi:hypothetical protein